MKFDSNQTKGQKSKKCLKNLRCSISPLLAIGKNSSFKTAIIRGAAGGTNAVAAAKTRAGDASIGSKHNVTEMHSKVLVSAAFRTNFFSQQHKNSRHNCSHPPFPKTVKASIRGTSDTAHYLEHILERCAAGSSQTPNRSVRG
jgi:hypothetical protein